MPRLCSGLPVTNTISRMINIHAFMVVKNEGGRYLQSSGTWLSTFVDSFFVFDDQSTDDSVSIAKDLGAQVAVRASGPSFLEHEGNFKTLAWQVFEEIVRPNGGDWVLAIDADEFLVSDSDVRLKLEVASSGLLNGVRIRIPELWELNPPRIRADGNWGNNSLVRFFRYQTGGRFDDKSMGCGSSPTYVFGSPAPTAGLEILHVGYADKDDVDARYARYSSIDHGHNSTHIDSIVQAPHLIAYDGPLPDIWRGRK